MLEDTLRPNSDVAVIVVHHTSRFTRDSTEARVVKAKLHRLGVRVVSTCQEITDDPIGNLIEGLFECIDQYESELNGIRTSAAMAEAARQGFFPGSKCPYGFRTRAVECRPGVVRHVLEPDEDESAVVREIYQLYLALGGAKAVARRLNQRHFSYRGGRRWSKTLVGCVLDESAVAGTYVWGKQCRGRKAPVGRQTLLPVRPLVNQETYELVQRLRADRRIGRGSCRASAKPHLLGQLVRCGHYGASYQLETSGKAIDGTTYRYCYYNCRTFCRVGKEACAGHRVATDVLDALVLDHVVEAVCAGERLTSLRRTLASNPRTIEIARLDPDELRRTWCSVISGSAEVARAYLVHLVERVVVFDDWIEIVPRLTAQPSAGAEAHLGP